MKKSGKPPEPRRDQLSCECECANCEIGAHERCVSPKCLMPKWKDIKPSPSKHEH
jgi:hypothetical protein